LKQNFKHKKNLGQNFLISDFHVAKIIDSIKASNGSFSEKIILEIACGTGALTNKLVKDFSQSKIYAIDLDPEALSLIPESNNLVKIREDILKFDFETLKQNNQQSELIILGNLPFQIATEIFLKIIGEIFEFEWNIKNVKFMLLMFQKEVAQRISALPSQKAYNKLSVFSQLKAEIKYLFDVPRNCFQPEPKVDAGVLKILPKANQEFFKLSKEQKEFFQKLVKTVFLYKRKKISSSLKFLLQEGLLEKIKDQFDLNLRAENFSTQDFITITKLVKKS